MRAERYCSVRSSFTSSFGSNSSSASIQLFFCYSISRPHPTGYFRPLVRRLAGPICALGALPLASVVGSRQFLCFAVEVAPAGAFIYLARHWQASKQAAAA